MFKKRMMQIAVIALFLAGFTAWGLAAATPVPVKVQGRIMIGETVTMVAITLTREGSPLAGFRVKVAGRAVPELGAGDYKLLVQEPLAAPGKSLQVTVEPPLLAGHSPATITASTMVAPWVAITAPANEAHAAADGPDLEVAWSGGHIPYHLTARPEQQPGEYAFEEFGILARRKAVPMSHFAKGKRYLLNVDFEAKDFIFSGPVERGSRLALLERSKPVRINVD